VSECIVSYLVADHARLHALLDLWDFALHSLYTGRAGHGKHNMLWC
jgi:hypothetical protein